MKKIIFTSLVFCFTFALAFSFCPTAFACDPGDPVCTEISDTLNGWVNTENWQNKITEIENGFTSGQGDMCIEGGGLAGEDIGVVNIEANVLQYDVISETNTAGNITHVSEALMTMEGNANTGDDCSEITIDMTGVRDHLTTTTIVNNEMTAATNNTGFFEVSLKGDDVNYGVSLNQLNAYTSENNTGGIQSGYSLVELTGGNLPAD